MSAPTVASTPTVAENTTAAPQTIDLSAEIATLKARVEELEAQMEQLAVWDTAYINSLPDSAFLVIEPGGKKDEDGKTVPRGLRHLPVEDASGKPDCPHVKNAWQRTPQVKPANMPKDELIRKARSAIKPYLEKCGIKVTEQSACGCPKTIEEQSAENAPAPEAKPAPPAPAPAPAAPTPAPDPFAKLNETLTPLMGKVDSLLTRIGKMEEEMKALKTPPPPPPTPEVKPEPKPEPKPEVKPTPKPETKPEDIEGLSPGQMITWVVPRKASIA